MEMEALGGPPLAAGQEARGVDEVPAKSVDECNDGENPPTVTSSAPVLCLQGLKLGI